MKKLIKTVLALCLLAGAGAMMTGCGNVSMTVVRYPSFWSPTEEYHSIAVAPVTNLWEAGAFTGYVGEGIVRDLVNDGTYVIYDHTHEYIDDGTLANQVRATGEAELVLTSSITDYKENRYEEDRVREEVRPVFAIGPNGRPLLDENGHPVIDHEETVEVHYPWFNSDARATLYSSLIRATDGKTIYTNTIVGECHDDAAQPFEVEQPFEMIKCAVRNMTSNVSTPLIPVYRTISVDEDDLLSLKNSAGNEADAFAINDQMTISTNLPDAARMNSFVIDIVPKGTNNVISSNEFIWERSKVSYLYSISELVESCGAKEYTVRFWNGNGVALSKDFKVK